MNSKEAGRSRASSSRGHARLATVVTITILVAIGLVSHWDNFSYGLVGSDTYSQILASRIQAFDDFLDTFREPLTNQLILAGFYRPVQNLSIALDYSLWGLDPFGYQLTSMLWFIACIVLLHLTTRRLLGGAWLGPTAATLLFVLHPTLLNVLPTPCRRAELLATVFLLATLLVLPVVGSRWRWRRLTLAGVFVLLAAGAKETGTLGLALVFLHQFMYADASGFGRRVRIAILASLPAAAAVTLYLICRTLVLGAVGGYDVELADSYGVMLGRAAAQLCVDVCCPWSFVSGLTPMQMALVPLVIGGGLAAAFLAVGLRRRDDVARNAGRMVVLGAAWIVPLVLVLGVNPRYGPWYALMPLVGALLIVAAVAQGVGRLLRQRGGGRLLGIVAAVGVVAMLAVTAWAAPLWTDYPEWATATQLLQAAQTRLDEKLRDIRRPGDVRVRIVPRCGARVKPERPFSPSPECPLVYGVGIWKAEGVHAWLRMRYPDKLVRVTYAARPAEAPAGATRLLLELDQSYKR